MSQSRELIVCQRLQFSVLFPEVHRLVRYALVRYFHVLQLRCVKPLLDVCAEKLTRHIIALPEKRNAFTRPFLDLGEIHGFAEERIDTLVHCWHNEISMYDDPDIANVVLPKIFKFTREQVLLKEPDVYPFYLSENDIAVLSMLLVKNTTVFYRGANWWSNKRQIERTLGHWFITPNQN
ncbi:MAG: hypothetical protein UU88_C0011G0023 [Parcubacteria group bacterium GW2011_GWC1_42_11]|nr:MAG: hypothetical protein UU88_C0011G0023 [Parcubacteria group bacterium GW2011_GWC1_42_11]